MSKEVQGNLSHGPAETENPNKNEDNETVPGHPLRDVPERLQEFTENAQPHQYSPSSSHELPIEPRAKVVPGTHSIFTHFPKDRNCDICLRTKITKASCRKRSGTVVPGAENYGDLTNANHKVLSEGCESRHNHRYAIVAQDLATQWIQSYPCKTQTSQETQKSLQKFLQPTSKPKVIYTEFPWNQGTSTPHGILKRDMLIADIEELEQMDASELHAKDSMQRKC